MKTKVEKLAEQLVNAGDDIPALLLAISEAARVKSDKMFAKLPKVNRMPAAWDVHQWDELRGKLTTLATIF